MFNNIERIKRYVADKKSDSQPSSIPLDLSKIVNENHDKRFATKSEVKKLIVNLTNEYKQDIEEYRTSISPANARIIGEVENLNVRLSNSLATLVKKAKSDKIELSESFTRRIVDIAEKLGKRISLVDSALPKFIESSETQVKDLQDLVVATDKRLQSLILSNRVTVKAGRNVDVVKKETKEGIEYTISSKGGDIQLHQLHNMGVQQIVAGSNIIVSGNGKGTVTISSTGGGAGSTFYAGDNITIEGLTISAVVSGSTVYAGEHLAFTGLTLRVTPETIGLSSLLEKSYNSLSDRPDLSNYIVGDSVFGQYILGSSFHSAVIGVSSSTASVGVSNNQAIIVNVIPLGLGLSAFGEKSYDSLTDKLGFVGTGGVSISQTGNTFTIFGLSSAINTNQVAEGVSNFYYTEARFTTSFGTKNTNDLIEGVSNFYYNPRSFVGTGGVSVSVTGRTVTIFGNSTALNTNQVTEGISNFYYRNDRISVGVGLSIFRSGVSTQIGLNISGITAHSLGGNGVYESKLQSKSFFTEGPTSTDFIPIFRVEQSMVLVKTVYDVSGGSNWVGQIQRWNNAQGASKYNTQTADSGVTTSTTVTSYTGASLLSGEYIALKGASIAGGVSWLLVNFYFREN